MAAPADEVVLHRNLVGRAANGDDEIVGVGSVRQINVRGPDTGAEFDTIKSHSRAAVGYGVLAIATIEDVDIGALAAIDGIVSGAAGDPVGDRRTLDRVGPRRLRQAISFWSKSTRPQTVPSANVTDSMPVVPPAASCALMVTVSPPPISTMRSVGSTDPLRSVTWAVVMPLPSSKAIVAIVRELDDRVLAVAAIEQIAVATRAARQRIIAETAGQRLTDDGAGDRVGAGRRPGGKKRVGDVGLRPYRAIREHDLVDAAGRIREHALERHDVARRQRQNGVIGIDRRAGDGNVACPDAGAEFEPIVAAAGVGDGILTTAHAEQIPIVAAAAGQRIVACPAIDGVVAVVEAVDGVAAGGGGLRHDPRPDVGDRPDRAVLEVDRVDALKAVAELAGDIDAIGSRW